MDRFLLLLALSHHALICLYLSKYFFILYNCWYFKCGFYYSASSSSRMWILGHIYERSSLLFRTNARNRWPYLSRWLSNFYPVSGSLSVILRLSAYVPNLNLILATRLIITIIIMSENGSIRINVVVSDNSKIKISIVSHRTW